MSNGPLPIPRLQFINGNGVPLAGGSVTTYASNGSTLVTTYQDSTTNNPNTNPIILDSNGTAAIWGNGQYVLKVQDSLGNTLYTAPTQYTPFSPAVGSLISILYYSTPGSYTFTPASSVLAVYPKVQAAGGAGGGAPATSSGQVSVGAGGGSGGYGEALITSGFSGVTITVGAGGTGSSGSAGGSGGGSSFGSLITTNGGGGGQTSISSAIAGALGGSPGAVGSGPGYNCIGNSGLNAFAFETPALVLMANALTAPSPIGLQAGSGGASTANLNSGSAMVGLAGQGGIVVVYCYGNA